METLFVGRNIIFLSEVDSTNSYAIKLLKNVNVAEGSVVHTTNQTNGRGQRGNVWNSEPASNLTASVVLKPVFLELKNQFFLYQITALACYDVMAELIDNSQFDIKIKWPNDILINGAKIAGILIENVVLNQQLAWSVVGIGINVNQDAFEKGVNATSLKLITGKNYVIDFILNLLCEKVEKYYLLLKNNKSNLIKDYYLKHFFNINKWQDFKISGDPKTLLIKGISTNGLLLLENKDGSKTEFDVKEIVWIL